MTSPLATHVLSNEVHRLQIMIARSGSAHGSGRRSTAFTTLKMAAFAPMPSPSVSTATAAKPGWRPSVRAPKRRSCQSVSQKVRMDMLRLRRDEEQQRLVPVNLR